MNEEILKLLLSLLVGVLIGLEREYKFKSAGIRTITLISVGSTLFTILSIKIGLPGSPDRIASNIITGIGFIGAGVIYKNNESVNGLTTAATIWIAAAIGMAIGNGDFVIAFTSLIFTLTVLVLLNFVPEKLNNFHQIRVYKLSFRLENANNKDLEDIFRKFNLKYRKLKEFRNSNEATSVYELKGHKNKLDTMNEYLMSLKLIDSFAY